MRTLTTQVFAFLELSYDAQLNAANDFKDINLANGWWNHIILDAELMGISIKGFKPYSMPLQPLKAVNMVCYEDIKANVMEYHDPDSVTFKTVTTFKGENMFYKLVMDYKKILSNEYERLQSFEAVRDTILMYNFEFFANGDLFVASELYIEQKI